MQEFHSKIIYVHPIYCLYIISFCSSVLIDPKWSYPVLIHCPLLLQGKLDNNNKKPKYVQISVESYTNLTGLEDQVKSYEVQVQGLEDEVKELSEKLSEAHLEMINKENLVKQHAKVAEEAVSG